MGAIEQEVEGSGSAVAGTELRIIWAPLTLGWSNAHPLPVLASVV